VERREETMYDSRNDNMGDDEVRGSEVSQCQTPVEWERYLPVNMNTRTVWSVGFPIYMGTDAQHQREGRPRWTPYRQSAEMREGIYYTCVIPGVSWLSLAELERRVGQQSSLWEWMWKREGSTCRVLERILYRMSIESSSMGRRGSS